MRDEFDPLPGAEGWQLSNPPILPLAAMRASMDLFDQAGIQQLHDAARAHVKPLYDALHNSNSIKIITPENPDERGCQLSLLVKENGRALFDALTKNGVIADWREPEVIRIAPVPLYNSWEDIEKFLDILAANLGKR
jgi:kynureninase